MLRLAVVQENLGNFEGSLSSLMDVHQNPTSQPRMPIKVLPDSQLNHWLFVYWHGLMQSWIAIMKRSSIATLFIKTLVYAQEFSTISGRVLAGTNKSESFWHLSDFEQEIGVDRYFKLATATLEKFPEVESTIAPARLEMKQLAFAKFKARSDEWLSKGDVGRGLTASLIASRFGDLSQVKQFDPSKLSLEKIEQKSDTEYHLLQSDRLSKVQSQKDGNIGPHFKRALRVAQLAVESAEKAGNPTLVNQAQKARVTRSVQYLAAMFTSTH